MNISHLPALARVRFTFIAQDALRLPPYAGSLWRGAFGHGLKQTVCVTRQPRCDGCLLRKGCVYSQVFESPPAPAKTVGQGAAIPHPFVLDVPTGQPRDRAAGDVLTLGMTLLGPALSHLPYVVHALRSAGERGLGKGQTRVVLHEVLQEAPWSQGSGITLFSAPEGTLRPLQTIEPVVPPVPVSVHLEFTTPLRIKHQNDLLGPREFRFPALVKNLLWRLESLARAWGGGTLGLPVADLLASAEAVEAEYRLYWQDWTRYSSRQEVEMQMGGLMGHLTLGSPGLAALWPWLWRGQWVHAGKGTGFGLGAYRLMDSASLPERAD
ncbi:CRISPR-associated protein Cas6 C-terminal domain-containing protein [Gammaproteobacteria bacterium]